MRDKKKPWFPGQYSLPRSFGFAISGLWHALRYERNLRIHFTVGALVLYFSRYYSLSSAEYALLIMMIGFVIVCELFNTAIEKTVDLETPVYNSLAKIAKDVAAGAVFVSAWASAVAGAVLLWDPAVIAVICRDVLARLYIWIPLAVLATLWIGFPQKKTRRGG